MIHLRRSFEQLHCLQNALGEVDSRLSWAMFRTVAGDKIPVTEDGQDCLIDDSEVSILLRDVVRQVVAMA